MNFRRMFAPIVAILIASVPVAAQNNNGAGNTERNAEAMKKLMDSPLRKLQIAEFAITNLYVDTLNESKLVEDAINGMLKELDPHSSYTPAKEVQKLTEPLQGSFEGIGVQYNMINCHPACHQRTFRVEGNHCGRPHRACRRHYHCGREDDT